MERERCRALARASSKKDYDAVKTDPDRAEQREKVLAHGKRPRPERNSEEWWWAQYRKRELHRLNVLAELRRLRRKARVKARFVSMLATNVATPARPKATSSSSTTTTTSRRSRRSRRRCSKKKAKGGRGPKPRVSKGEMNAEIDRYVKKVREMQAELKTQRTEPKHVPTIAGTAHSACCVWKCSSAALCCFWAPCLCLFREPHRFVRSKILVDKDSSSALRIGSRVVAKLLVATATAPGRCKFTNEQISQHKSVSSAKASHEHYRFGDMIQGGWGGLSVGSGKRNKKTNSCGRGFYAHTRDALLGELAHRLCLLAKAAGAEEDLDAMFGKAKAALLDTDPRVDNAVRLDVRGGAACFVTLQFSHDRWYPEEDNVSEVVHEDPRDQSSTLLYLFQAEDTPEVHRAHWYDENNDEFIPIAGGLFLIFNGRKNFHGLIPPEVISDDKRWAWYGSTVLMKSLPAGKRKKRKKQAWES